jgi:hypothetical protein
MEYPKMLYSAAQKVADQEAIKAGLRSGAIRTQVVASAEAQEAAEGKGWFEDLASLIAAPKKTKAA